MRPRTLEVFLRRPTRGIWNRELRAGWTGPDGSSLSTDTILGVRIGATSSDYRYVDLPANRHDWLYRLGRRYDLPESWRKAADQMYRDLSLGRCRVELRGWRRAFAVVRCHARYAGLRAGARFAWTRNARLRRDAWRGGGGEGSGVS